MNCIRCGKEIERKGTRGSVPKYCGKYCRSHHSLESRRSKISDLSCEYCDNNLTQLQKDRGQKYCCQKCRGKAKRTIKGTIRNCVVCGLPFEPSAKAYRSCSQSCANKKARNIQIKNIKRNPKLMDCESCGMPFEYAEYAGSFKRKYCDVCGPRLERDRLRRRRKITRNKAIEKIVDVHIYARDNWVCQICGEHVNEHIEWPDPMSSSLDHIIPISKGGEHIKVNVQLAHLGCNSRKWNRL